MKRRTKRGSTRSYRCGTKNNSTRYGWNRLLELTAGNEKHWPIPYLSGPEDYDRTVAISKGVPPTNLIAIDDLKRNINRVRRNDGIAICADVVEVLYAWPRHTPVAAVVLDFCHGLEPAVIRDLIHVLCRPPFAQAWIWLNMLRGRDNRSNFIRADLRNIFGNPTKNRAEQFFLLLVGVAAADAVLRGRPDGTAYDWVSHMVRAHEPIFHSYKSRIGRATQVFDSVIFRARSNYFDPRQLDAVDAYERTLRPSPEVQRLVRANLAVRTMREDR